MMEQPIRRHVERWIQMGWLLSLLTVFAPVAASSPEDDAGTISMDVTEAYLEDVLKVLSKQSGINFVAAEAARDKTVTLYMDKVPIQDALGTLLAANRLNLRSTPMKNLFVVAPSNAPEVETVTRVFPLKYARVVPTVGEIFPIFGLTGSLIKESFGETSGTSTGTTGTTTGLGQGTGQTGGGLLGGIGQGAQGQGGLVRIVRSILTEHGSVVPDPRTNSLIVTDIAEQMPTIEKTIRELDLKPKQIYIEAEVVEVALETLRRIGVDYGNSTSGQIASYAGPTRRSHFPFSEGMFDGTSASHTLGTFSLSEANILFKLLATESDVKFLARPRLMTLSNEVAEIRIVAEAVTGTTSTSQQDTGVIIEEPERTTVGTILRVTPLVNDENYITMVIEPEVSRVIQSSTFTSFLDPNRRSARTTVMIQDGGTVMIAGLISSQDTQAARRVPGLGDIPILGIPFKRTETERSNTEILLFITPHILPEQAPPPVWIALEREQTPLTDTEAQALKTHRTQIVKGRAIEETIENLVR